MRRLAAALGLVLLALGAWRAWPPPALPALHGPGDCRRLALTDAATGAALAGIEDIAAVPGGLVLAAQDRLAAERAAAAGSQAPEGGLYVLPLAGLAQGGPLALADLGRDRFRGRLHPHGIDAAGARLAVVARGYGPEGARGEAVLVFAIEQGEAGPQLVPERRLADPALCAANDVALAGGTALVTLDREGCPGLAAAEAAWPLPTGRLVALRPELGLRLAVAGLVHPNGVVVTAEGPVVAETRAARLRLADGRHLDLPGAPDNLSLAGDGAILAAVHPDLLRLALYRHGWTGSAPSRLVRIAPGGSVEVLFDDPAGALFSAATVAVEVPGGLVAGSVRDAGLLVCGAPGATGGGA